MRISSSSLRKTERFVLQQRPLRITASLKNAWSLLIKCFDKSNKKRRRYWNRFKCLREVKAVHWLLATEAVASIRPLHSESLRTYAAVPQLLWVLLSMFSPKSCNNNNPKLKNLDSLQHSKELHHGLLLRAEIAVLGSMKLFSKFHCCNGL